MKIDYIIVGQGIAGTVLAYTLLQRGKKIVVVDDWNYSSSSKVAAGLYNPIVFKRLTKSWMADELISFMENFYEEMSNSLGEKIIHKRPIVKLFSGTEEKGFWLKQAQKPELKAFLSDVVKTDFSEAINGMEGGAEVKKSGSVDAKKMLTLFRESLNKNNSLKDERFNFDELTTHENSIEYKELRASKIIFCEGFRMNENPFFKNLSLKPAKGEVLTIKTHAPLLQEENYSLNKNLFVLPLDNNTYKVGATYEWEELNEIPTEKALKEITDKLEQIIKVPYEIINHEAGVRPSSKDRRPLIGLHPAHKVVGVFNGMGTKGVMLAPYWAQRFVEFLEGENSLPGEVDIARIDF